MATGAGRKTSRITRKTSTVSFDEHGLPVFGSVQNTVVAPLVSRAEKREKPQRKTTSMAEHTAYLRKLGYAPIMIPGTPERKALLEQFIADFHGYEPAHYRQLESWQRELAGDYQVYLEPAAAEVPDLH